MIDTRKTTVFCMTTMVLSVTLSGAAFAQGASVNLPPPTQTATTTLIAQNDKLVLVDVLFKPGDTQSIRLRPMHGDHVISGGTMERTYADGKTEDVQEVAGETHIIEALPPYALKNVGATTVHMVYIGTK